MYPREQVHRPFAVALVDEADSILLDEARIPLVIAGGESDRAALAPAADRVVRGFRKDVYFSVDDYARNIGLTEAGIQAVEKSFSCGNLFA
jgi:preprotein translocase subunit SecA